jgi:prephenate dehydrogenase
MADVIILGGGQEMPENYPRIQRSLGPYRVASELKKHGYDVVVIDYIQYLTVGEIINALSKVLTEKTLWFGYSSTFFYSNTPTATATSRMYQNISYSKISEIYSYVKNI